MMRLAGLVAVAAAVMSGASLREPAAAAGPVATATLSSAEFCFSRPRALVYERLPESVLMLRLRVKLIYANAGTRPLIVTVPKARTVYLATVPGPMKRMKGGIDLFAPALKPLQRLPANVAPDNPLSPPNDVFASIPAGGAISTVADEEIDIPVFQKKRPAVDLRGRDLYVRLQLDHQGLSPALEATLSDRWSRFGVPWSGMVRTNTLRLEIPGSPRAASCVDRR